MTKRVSFHTFGCRLNQSETASLENSFTLQGYDVVDLKDPADIVVINTCTVTQGGDADTRRLVYRVNRLNPKARIALVGCQAQVQKDQLASLPNVSWIVGNERKMDLVRVLSEDPEPQAPLVTAPSISRDPFVLPVASIDRQHRRANLKIQDGCDFFCSFCEIPYARGRARSRVFEDIFLEANTLVKSGHQEIILTGINLGTYRYGSKDILDVIEGLEKIDGLRRIRISSIEPTTIPDKLIERMRSGKLCRHLHIPLQSGDDQILSEMSRHYTAQEFLEFADRAFNNVDNICIGTDVIVGFPGESDAHFENTLTLLKDSPIHYCHVFSYSARQMAKSRLKEALPAAVITKRSQVLRALSERKRRAYYESQVGLEMDVLFESAVKGGWVGLTDNYVRVTIKSTDDLFNRFRKVRFVSCAGQTMIGEVV